MNLLKPIDSRKITDIVSAGELAQLVADGEIALYSKVNAEKVMLLTMENKSWLARAHGRFDGLCKLYKKDAVQCLRNGSVDIKAAEVSTDGFIDWSTESPFDIEFPIGNISAWKPIEIPEHDMLHHAVFNPTAEQPINRRLKKLNNNAEEDNDFAKFMSAVINQFDKAKTGNKTTLKTKPVTVHKLELLVDLKHLESLVSPKVNEMDKPHPDPEGRERWEINKKLESVGLKPTRLHQVLYRVMEASEDNSAKAVFNLIEKDFYSEDQELNVADTITEITDIYVYWEDSSGKNRRIKFKTLESRLSQLRQLN